MNTSHALKSVILSQGQAHIRGQHFRRCVPEHRHVRRVQCTVADLRAVSRYFTSGHRRKGKETIANIFHEGIESTVNMIPIAACMVLLLCDSQCSFRHQIYQRHLSENKSFKWSHDIGIFE